MSCCVPARICPTGRAQDIVSTDFKAYEAGNIKFGVAQVEVTTLNEISERLDEVRAALRALTEQRGLGFCGLDDYGHCREQQLVGVRGASRAITSDCRSRARAMACGTCRGW